MAESLYALLISKDLLDINSCKALIWALVRLGFLLGVCSRDSTCVLTNFMYASKMGSVPLGGHQELFNLKGLKFFSSSVVSSKNLFIPNFLKNSLRSFQILNIFGVPGVQQKVRPFSRTWTWALERCTSLRFTTERPSWLSTVDPGAKMPFKGTGPFRGSGVAILKGEETREGVLKYNLSPILWDIFKRVSGQAFMYNDLFFYGIDLIYKLQQTNC